MNHWPGIIVFSLLLLTAGNTQTLTVTPKTPEATIDSLHLSVYLWRDFQPISPPKGKPLRVKVAIRGTPKQLLDSLTIEKMLLVHQSDTVVVNGSDIQPLLERVNGELRWVWRKGPYWSPRSNVDVFVYARTPAGQLIRLEARQQPIHATF